jgi:hypothetical protein
MRQNEIQSVGIKVGLTSHDYIITIDITLRLFYEEKAYKYQNAPYFHRIRRGREKRAEKEGMTEKNSSRRKIRATKSVKSFKCTYLLGSVTASFGRFVCLRS